MSDAARYAIYLAPEQGSALARFANGILGYDAHSGADVPHAPELLPNIDWQAITTSPRRYGAHATLKAPFRLAAGRTRAALAEALDDFAARRRAFDIGPLAITCVSRDENGAFVALTNPFGSAELAALEAETVRHFEPFRAALSPDDVARRVPGQLTPRQRRHLAEFGYPFVLDDFAFHITLTERLTTPEVVADHLADRLAQELGTIRFRVDALHLFEQAKPEQRFRAVDNFPLRA